MDSVLATESGFWFDSVLGTEAACCLNSVFATEPGFWFDSVLGTEAACCLDSVPQTESLPFLLSDCYFFLCQASKNESKKQ